MAPSLAALTWLLLHSTLADAVIKIGSSGPLLLDYGLQLSNGMRFAFDEVNAGGGIMGQNLSLVALDDGLNATRTAENIVTLVEKEKVLALAGVVGTDIVSLAMSYILQRQIPYVGAYAGNADLHTPFHREFVNVRFSFADEMVAQAIYLVQYQMVQRFACVYQNDSFGTGGRDALVAALANVGIQLVASASYNAISLATLNVTAAVEAVAGAAQKAQVVVFVGVQEAFVQFVPMLVNDPRTDPALIFTVMSGIWGPSLTTTLDRKYWDNVYFFFTVPLPGDPSYVLAQRFAAAYPGANPISFEGYIVGRLIAQALTATYNPNPTSAMFLDAVYNTRMFVLDDLVVGLYSGNWTGCSVVLCDCNSGLRVGHVAKMVPALNGLGPSIGTLRFPITACAIPVSTVVAPLLFGQLLPDWDAGWHAVAADIGRGLAQAFAEADAKGGSKLLSGRRFMLLQGNYSLTASAFAALNDRFPLIGVIGSVVPNTAQISTPFPVVGDLDMQPDAQDDPFRQDRIALQPSTALELMALTQFAVTKGCAIHLRAPTAGNGPAMLDVMVASVNTFQLTPSSASLYTAGSDFLSGIPSGCVIALGSDADLLTWYTALPTYPALHLLTLSANTMRMMAVLPSASSLPQAPRWHFPTIITGQWNTTVTTNPSEGWKYGYILGTAAVQAIQHSEYADGSYMTPAQLLQAWYSVIVMTSGTVSVGPYQGAACTAGRVDCECNQGTRSVAVRSVASDAVESLYSLSTCHVVYMPLLGSSGVSSGTIAGAVVGGVVAVIILAGLWHLGRRNNHEAPKDCNKPFCVLFTDIQSSTHLWATIPDVMAPALDRHHELIRKLIAKHKCYEVKTIGDSFMCAAHTPRQAVEMSLAIQRVFFEFDWGSEAINAVYRESIPVGEEEEGRYSRACWNGLRVRVGIHYGQGDVKLDPVSKGYDYYGTVVNTAARIESACHGGQIGVSQAVYDALGGDLPGSVWSDLGRHELRGLSEPIHLYQILPDGPYSVRSFPPLRLEKEDQIHEALQASEEVAVATHTSGSTKGGDGGRGSLSTVAENWKWLEMHPLVVKGDVPADVLRKHYLIALTTLSTLLNIQTAKFKQTVVQGLCERLHVPNHGVAGAQLQATLKGLVQRVLPATVLAVQYCGNKANPESCDCMSLLAAAIDDGSHGGSFRGSRMRSFPLDAGSA